jgi:hypothetical protein
MEVKEAIEFINNGINLSTRDLEKEYLEKMDGIIALLQSLKAENKKLKKENEAYKGMWEKFKDSEGHIEMKYILAEFDTTIEERMNLYEQKYLGGGE